MSIYSLAINKALEFSKCIGAYDFTEWDSETGQVANQASGFGAATVASGELNSLGLKVNSATGGSIDLLDETSAQTIIFVGIPEEHRDTRLVEYYYAHNSNVFHMLQQNADSSLTGGGLNSNKTMTTRTGAVVLNQLNAFCVSMGGLMVYGHPLDTTTETGNAGTSNTNLNSSYRRMALFGRGTNKYFGVVGAVIIFKTTLVESEINSILNLIDVIGSVTLPTSLSVGANYGITAANKSGDIVCVSSIATDTNSLSIFLQAQSATLLRFVSFDNAETQNILSTDFIDVAQVEVLDFQPLSGNSSDSGNENIKAEISGTLTVDGNNASRQIVIIADDKKDGRRVVAEVQSDSDGTFKATYNDWAGAVIALALDNYGDAWKAETTLNAGTIVHPSTANGYVYEVTDAGTSGTEEPTWSTDLSTAVIDGSMTLAPKPFYRPIASGPIQGNVTYISTPNYRYVRLYVTETNGASYLGIKEIEIASTSGGDDITNASMTITESSYYATDTAAKAFDDRLTGDSSSWTTNGFSSPEFAMIDLEAAKDIAEVRIMADTGYLTRAPKAFEIQGSVDGSTFETIKAFSDVADWEDSTYKTFSLID